MSETVTWEQITQSLVYLVEGEPYIGTVNDYAKAVENAHYSGIGVDNTVWTFDADGKPVPTRVQFSGGDKFNEDDYAYLTIRVGADEATVKIDGRA